MSRLSDPEKSYEAGVVPERTLRRAPPKIIRNRRKNPVHPDEIKRLLYERSRNLPPVKTTSKGWLLLYWDKDAEHVTSRTHLVYVKDPDGTTRPATYNDAVRIRDLEMDLYEYEKCWLIMKTAEDT